MIIKINNEKEYIRFIKMLPLYRLSIFKLFNFENKSEYKDSKIIINALNIKSRKKRITYVYDETIKIIDKYYENKNLCKFKNSVCILHRRYDKGYKCGCCRKCIYNNGKCKTNNIACKMFYCSEAGKNVHLLKYEDIKLLNVLGPLSRIIIKSDYFSLREDVICDVYLGFFIAPFRIIYRNIKNSIKLKIKNKRLLVSKE